ncbi:MAG: hypothetical protein ABIK73_09065 [candidate division WOR-3 bacterium]
MIYRNVANQKLPLYLQDSSGNPVTGEASNITAYISVDGATPQTVSPVVEVGGGYYTITPSQEQTDGSILFWWGTHPQYICRGGAGFTSKDYTPQRAQKLDNLDNLTQSFISSSVWNYLQFDGSLTPYQLVSILAAILAGKVSVTENVVTFYAVGSDNTQRVVATVDSQGNRLQITLYPPE